MEAPNQRLLVVYGVSNPRIDRIDARTANSQEILAGQDVCRTTTTFVRRAAPIPLFLNLQKCKPWPEKEGGKVQLIIHKMSKKM